MTYIEVLQNLAMGKYAWRPPASHWPPKAYIKQHGSSLVLVDPHEKVYVASDKDKSASDWVVGMHRVEIKKEVKLEDKDINKSGEGDVYGK